MKKKLIPAIILAVVLVFGGLLIIYFASTSASDTATIKYPKGYTVINSDNAEDNEEYIEKLGYTVSSFQHYLEQKNVISFAANKNNSGQYHLVSYATEFTKDVDNISVASDKELEKIANVLIKQGYDYIYRYDGTAFYVIETAGTEENGYGAIQYVTIKNGKYYSLNYYGSTPELSKAERTAAENTLKTLKLPEKGGILSAAGSAGVKRTVYLIILTLVVLGGMVCIVLYTVSIVKDIRKNKNENTEEQFIKRRKK